MRSFKIENKKYTFKDDIYAFYIRSYFGSESIEIRTNKFVYTYKKGKFIRNFSLESFGQNNFVKLYFGNHIIVLNKKAAINVTEIINIKYFDTEIYRKDVCFHKIFLTGNQDETLIFDIHSFRDGFICIDKELSKEDILEFTYQEFEKEPNYNFKYTCPIYLEQDVDNYDVRFLNINNL